MREREREKNERERERESKPVKKLYNIRIVPRKKAYR